IFGLGTCRLFFFSSRRRHTRWPRDWSSDVCSSDLPARENSIRGNMSFTPVLLTLRQRQEVRRAIDDVASRYKWKIHNVAVQQDRSEERRVGKECRCWA